MAACNSIESVPKDIAERYLPGEAPTFEVIRRTGEVRLWKSVTKPQYFADWARPARTHFHISNGQEASIVLMSDMERAIPNFEMEVTRANGSKEFDNGQH